MMEDEKWRPVLGYEGLYEVSNCGRVRSLDRVEVCKNGCVRRRKGQVLRARHDHGGYGLVDLYKKGRKNTRTVHSLVAEAFIGPRPKGLQIRHLNGNPRYSHFLVTALLRRRFGFCQCFSARPLCRL